MELVSQLRSRGNKCYLVSDNEAYRGRYLLDEVRVGKHFDGTFFSCFLGFTKGQKEFFEKILADTNAKAGEVLYIDDDQENLNTAKPLGTKTYLYQDLSSLKQHLQLADLA